MLAVDVIKENNIEELKNLIQNNEKFDDLSWTDWQSLKKEAYDVLKEHNLEIDFNNIMATQDRRIHEELLSEDKELIYKAAVWQPILHFKWNDLIDFDWDFDKFERKNDFLESILYFNNFNAFKRAVEFTDKLYVSDLKKAKDALESRGEVLDERIVELLIEKKKELRDDELKDLLSCGYIDAIERTGYLDKNNINALIVFGEQLFLNSMNIHSSSKPPYKLNEADSNRYIEMIKSGKYDVNEQSQGCIHKFQNSFDTQVLIFTPLSFLKHFVVSKEKTRLITKLLKESENLFDNQFFEIKNYNPGNNVTRVHVSEFYFETFSSKTNQKTFIEKMTPESYKKLVPKNKKLFDEMKKAN